MMSNVKGKRVAVLVEKFYEDLELWYPVMRLREAGCDVKIVGPKAGETYASKHGYPAKSDVAASEVKASDFDAIIIPGGYSPDHMRRHPPMVDLVTQAAKQGKILASICHGPWMLCSAKCLKGKKVTGFFAIRDDVENAGGIWQDAACVRDGNIVTSRTPDDLPAFMQGILAALGDSQLSVASFVGPSLSGWTAVGSLRHLGLTGTSHPDQHGPLTSDKLVYQILEHLLAAADVLGGVALGENVRLEVAEAGLAGFDATAELAIPAPVAFLDERGEPAVGDDRAGDLEAAGKRVHAADMGVKQVDRLEALAAHLGVEVDAAGREAPHAGRMASMHWVVR